MVTFVYKKRSVINTLYSAITLFMIYYPSLERVWPKIYIVQVALFHKMYIKRQVLNGLKKAQ